MFEVLKTLILYFVNFVLTWSFLLLLLYKKKKTLLHFQGFYLLNNVWWRLHDALIGRSVADWRLSRQWRTDLLFPSCDFVLPRQVDPSSSCTVALLFPGGGRRPWSIPTKLVYITIDYLYKNQSYGEAVPRNLLPLCSFLESRCKYDPSERLHHV